MKLTTSHARPTVGGRGLRLVLAAMVSLGALSPAAVAAAAWNLVIVEYTVSGASPNGIATGPDGNLWFTDENNNSVDRFTLNGTVTTFPCWERTCSPARSPRERTGTCGSSR